MTEATFQTKTAEQDAVLENYGARVQSIETLGGLAPGEASDATMASHIAQPLSQSRHAMNNAVSTEVGTAGSTIRSTVVSTANEAAEVAVPPLVAEAIGGDSAVIAAAVVAVGGAAASMDLVTASGGEDLPSLPAEPLVTSLAFSDENERLAFVVDGVGGKRPRVRQEGVLYPSGDTTGATDLAAVNAALLENDRVVLKLGEWFGDGSIVMQSNTNLHLEGPLNWKLTDLSNSNVITNLIGTTTVEKIAVTGQGDIHFDANGVNQVRQDLPARGYSGWKNVGAHFCNVDGLIVWGITIANTAMFGALCTGVRNALWLDVTIEQDLLVPNQDGIDIGPACSYITIKNTRGNTEDDVHSIFAKYSTSQNTVHQLYRAGAADGMNGTDGALYSVEGNDTHNIYIDGSHVDSGKNFFRLQAAEGSKLYEIHATNTRHTGTTPCRTLVIFGEMLDAYIDAPPASDGTDFHTISFDGFSGRVESLVYLDSHIKDVVINDADLPRWGNILTQRDLNDPAPSARNLVIDGVTSSQGNVAGNNNIIGAAGGMTLIDCSITGVRLPSIDRVIANTGSTIRGLVIEAVVGEILSGAFYELDAVESTVTRASITSRSTVADWGTAPTLATNTDTFVLEAS